MGLATIDSHSQKEHTEIHKIPKFGELRNLVNPGVLSLTM